jgi:putative DNA-invertase from lambdoid prophage Rac
MVQGASLTVKTVPIKPRVALYARVSTAEGKQFLENQLRELREYVKRMEWTSYHWEFTDKITGMSQSRPGLDALLEAATERKFDRVVVVDLSRLTRRGPASAFQLIERLKNSGVDMWSIREEYFRTSGPAGAMLIAIAAFIAAQERETIRARVMAGIARARAAGKHLGPPLTIVDRKKCARLRDAGVSVRECARRLKVGKNVILRLMREREQE